MSATCCQRETGTGAGGAELSPSAPGCPPHPDPSGAAPSAPNTPGLGTPCLGARLGLPERAPGAYPRPPAPGPSHPAKSGPQRAPSRRFPPGGAGPRPPIAAWGLPRGAAPGWLRCGPDAAPERGLTVAAAAGPGPEKDGACAERPLPASRRPPPGGTRAGGAEVSAALPECNRKAPRMRGAPRGA